MHSILVVDLDTQVATKLADESELGQYEVHTALGVEQAQGMLATILYTVVIVNTALVRTEGEQWRFVRYVRGQSARSRVLFLRPARGYSIGFRDGFAGDALLPRSTDTATLVRVVQHLAEGLDHGLYG